MTSLDRFAWQPLAGTGGLSGIAALFLLATLAVVALRRAVSSSQTTRLNRALEALLDARRERRDLNVLAREAVELYVEASPVHELRLSVPGDPVMVRCDPALVAKVLRHLLRNAIKYSPSGGRVEIRVAAASASASVAVSDSGIGVAATDLVAIFRPSPEPGAGLGLAQARRIMQAHGGDLELERRAAEGSTFRLRLPLAPSTPAD